jgi:hypothetical protein
MIDPKTETYLVLNLKYLDKTLHWILFSSKLDKYYGFKSINYFYILLYRIVDL